MKVGALLTVLLFDILVLGIVLHEARSLYYDDWLIFCYIVGPFVLLINILYIIDWLMKEARDDR